MFDHLVHEVGSFAVVCNLVAYLSLGYYVRRCDLENAKVFHIPTMNTGKLLCVCMCV